MYLDLHFDYHNILGICSVYCHVLDTISDPHVGPFDLEFLLSSEDYTVEDYLDDLGKVIFGP